MIKQIIKYLLLKLKKIQNKVKLAGYECLYPFYKNKFSPSPHQCYSLTAKQIYGDHRAPGVSGYSRLYNEEDFLCASVESHLPFFDELILIHDNTVTDKTPEIAQALAKKYPDKVKYFIYEPEAFKLRTKAYKILPANHPNSFVNYSNFALSKTTKQIVSKVDGDHIAIQSEFEKVINNIKNMAFMQDIFYIVCGINLWQYKNKIYVDPSTISGLGDNGFHIMTVENRYYTKDISTEGINFKSKKMQNAGILYFHLKNMRSGIAKHSYRGLSDEIHQKKFHQRKLKIQQYLVDWPKFIIEYRDIFLQKTNTDIAQLPDPNIYLKEKLPHFNWIVS